MAPKHKDRKAKPTSKQKHLPEPAKAKADQAQTKRQCKKELIFRDDDDNTPIAHLVHKAPGCLPPKTPIRHETASAASQDLFVPPLKSTAVESTQPRKRQCRAPKHRVHKESHPQASPEKLPTQSTPTSPQFTYFTDMSQENNRYTMQIKLVHFWSASISALATSPSGFLLIKDTKGSLMQAFIPDFLLARYKDTFSRGLSFEIRDVILFKSTRRTKLIDSPFELHFTETTVAIQIEDLPIDLDPPFNFEPLCKTPNFLPPGDITTSQLTVKDILCMVVDMTPVLKRFRRGKVIRFIEASITDPTIWPSYCLLTIWEDTALRYGKEFLHGFTEQFLLIAQHVRPNCYKGKYGYQTNSFTILTYNPAHLPAADLLLNQLHALATSQSSTLQPPTELKWFRKDPLVLHTLSTLKTETHTCPAPGQDKQFVIPAMVLRLWNDTNLTYRCCPLCWTAMREGPSFPTGCSKQNCPNKEGLSIQRYRAKIIVVDNTSRATLTLFDQAAEELFNTSSDDIARFQSEAGGNSRIASILQEAMNKHFLFYIRVTSTNFRYISNMYSSGYTAESAEWIPRAYKPHPHHQPYLLIHPVKLVLCQTSPHPQLWSHLLEAKQ